MGTESAGTDCFRKAITIVSPSSLVMMTRFDFIGLILVGLSLAVPCAVSAANERGDIAEVALEFVRSSANYVENGGFGERIVEVRVNETIAEVTVDYSTRHVGMLQVIGRYLCHVYVNSTTLEVIDSRTETNFETEPCPSDPQEGNATSSGRAEGSQTGKADKVAIAINQTRAIISRHLSEANFSSALSLLDLAESRLAQGQLDEAYELLSRARRLVDKILGGDQPDEGPNPVQTPWLYGYIVVFDHEPTDQDWNVLAKSYNASKMFPATGYTDNEHAFWVRVNGTSPEELRTAPGVVDVIVLRGAPVQTEQQVNDMSVATVYALAFLSAAAKLKAKFKKLKL